MRCAQHAIAYSEAYGGTWLSGTSTGPQKARVTGSSCCRRCWWLCQRWMSALAAGSSGSHRRSRLMTGLYQGTVPVTVGGWLSAPWMPRVVLVLRRYSTPAADRRQAQTQRAQALLRQGRVYQSTMPVCNKCLTSTQQHLWQVVYRKNALPGPYVIKQKTMVSFASRRVLGSCGVAASERQA